MIEYSIFTVGGKMTWQHEYMWGDTHMVKRVVQQPDGSLWRYLFRKGGNIGAPLRSKARQPELKMFVAEVESALN